VINNGNKILSLSQSEKERGEILKENTERKLVHCLRSIRDNRKEQNRYLYAVFPR
jgi:hypothetical protein